MREIKDLSFAYKRLLVLLKNGKIEEFNRKRPLFLDFSNLNFNDANFTRANFNGARFNGAKFNDANFNGARFEGARFNGANFEGASFNDAIFYGARFDGARFDDAIFYRANFNDANFYGANFYGASFNDSSFDRARFDGAIFYGARFDYSFKKKILSNKTLMNKMFKSTKKYWIVYKTFGEFYESPKKWEIEEGKTIKNRIDENRWNGCSYGINVGNLDYVIQNKSFRQIYILHVPKEAEICVPFFSEGKVRVSEAKIIKIIKQEN